MTSDIKAQVSRAKREDKIATGILMAIVAFIFILLAALIVYIIASGAQKAFDPSFLTGKPEQFKEGGGMVSLTGTMFVFLSALLYAIYLVYVNRSPRLNVMPTLKLTFYVILSGTFMFGLMTLLGNGIKMPESGMMWTNVVCLAVLPTALSFYCTTQAITLIGSTPTAILGAIEPLTAVFLGVIILGEPMTMRIAWGFLLVISGVSLIVARGNISATLVRIRKMFPKKIRKRHHD